MWQTPCPNLQVRHCMLAYCPINSAELRHKSNFGLKEQKLQESDFNCKKGQWFPNKSSRKQCHLATKLIREQNGPRRNLNTVIFTHPHLPYAVKQRFLHIKTKQACWLQKFPCMEDKKHLTWWIYCSYLCHIKKVNLWRYNYFSKDKPHKILWLPLFVCLSLDSKSLT